MDNVRTAKTTRVLNRAPAPIQITAEQIVLEARDRSDAALPPPPKLHITDPQELAAQRMRVRKEFEDKLRMQRMTIGIWLRYGKWEESQNEIERARSIYERALDIEYKNPHIWIAYAEMEMRGKFVNRARNVWDRAITLLPRVETFWYKYTYMEEILGNVAGARVVFERWMQWEPSEQAWSSYINLELRAGEIERARSQYERFVACHPLQASYLRFAKWEERNRQSALARRVYERALDELRADEQDENLFSAFALFEERCGEVDRSRLLLQLGIERLGKDKSGLLARQHVAFEKQHGDTRGVESVIMDKRRAQYEAAVAVNPTDYDVWFDYARLEESEGDATRIRSIYERAVANVPPIVEKRFWRRYIYLWINYALYEETTASDFDRARGVLQRALVVVPHAIFTFSKLWLLAARFEVRRKNLDAMRRLLGSSLGRCPRVKIAKGYIALELQLGEVDRCRRLYEKFTSLWPMHVHSWVAFSDLERSLAEEERAAAVLELAVSQPVLDVPEVAWKAYIDFEIGRGELGNARALYERLLLRSKHAKVWLSYATFEGAQVGDAALSRAVYAAAYTHFKGVGAAGREERVLMLEAWLAFERAVVQDEVEHGGDGSANAPFLRAVQAKVPNRVVRKRELTAADGSSLGWEEYYDWVFPDDETKPAALKLLEMAHRWRAGGGTIAAALRGDAEVNSEGPLPSGEASVEGVDTAPLAGSIRRRSVDDAEEGGSGSNKRLRQLESYGEGENLEQSCADEAATPNASVDAVFQVEVEREMEARVRAARSSAEAPRDLYCEEDAGEAADRDTVA